MLLLQHPSQRQQATSKVRCVMSTFCEVARGIDFLVVVDMFSFHVVEMEDY